MGAIISFDTASGSNTAASGYAANAGLAATALSGTGASLTNASASIDLSADSPNLANVAAGDKIWVGTSTGRQFYTVSSVNNTTKVVTAVETAGATESGKNWGIGGKRATLAGSTTIFVDAKAGDTVRLKAGQTHTLTAALSVTCQGDGTTGPIVVDTDTPGTRATITTATNSVALFSGNNAARIMFKDILFSTTAGVKTVCWSNATTASDSITFSRCKFDGFTTPVSNNSGTNRINNMTQEGCESANMTTGFTCGLANNNWFVGGCWFHDCTTGILVDAAATNPPIIEDAYITNNTTGISCTVNDTTFGYAVDRCVIANNSSHGINHSSTAFIRSLTGNVFYGNGGYGINSAGTLANWQARMVQNACNAFGSNTSGAYASPVPAGTDEVTLGANNPFEASASKDYRINPVSTGGGLVNTAGYPRSVQANSSYTNYRTIGGFQIPQPTLPAVGDVELDVAFGYPNGHDVAGSLVVPDEDDVANGVGYGAYNGITYEFTGTLSGGGGGTFPSAGDVRSGTVYGPTDNLTGTLNVPTIGNVRSGITYGAGGSEYTGTLVLPAIGNVRSGTGFGAGAGTEYTGTLALPAVANVLSTVSFGASGSEFTGTYVVVAVGNVRDGTTFGAASGQTGTLVLPAVSDVRSGTQYGAAGTQYTGVLNVSGGSGGTSFIGGGIAG